ncbi:MAG TPA: sugar ABC transporter substrate-binding protein [Gaiellaceae bacterium]|nr:sugar ABC transporter substrate-binding protein [Gaiellaceae bacterium]
MRRRFVLAGAIVALAVAGAAVFASTASGTGAKRTRQQKTINVAVFLASAANTYWEAALLGAKDVAKKNPNVKLTVFDGKFNTNTQLSQLRDALVSKKYQAWFVGPNDGGPLTPTIKQAIKQGVKVGCALVPCGPNIRDVHVQIPGQVIFAGLGFYPNGQQLGRLVVQGCSGISDCQVLWLPGLPTLPLEVARQAGLYSVIKSHKNIHVVATAAGGYLAAPALTATENVLRAHPNLNVIVSSGDQMIAGAYKAEQLAGKSGIKMYGNGCTFEAKQLILQGKQTGCSVYLPRTEGRLVVQAIVNAVNGSKKTGIYVNPLKYSPIGGLGTKANIAKFKPEFHS